MSFESSSNATADSFEAVPDNGTVGLSDPNYSSTRRQMLDLINRLHGTGVQADMDLPMIAVIGSQSAGKSSLIESISGITLPRASGTCTRCPTECRLSSSNGEWKCLVSLRFTTDPSGNPLGQALNEPFGEPIFDKSLVEDRIRRAQRAILSPSILSSEFLTADLDNFGATEVAFSMNCISLQISGRQVADLSFVDLPGMIASGPDKNIIENLVLSYIQKPSCIILLTVACETDWENQRGFDFANHFDKGGRRTIGVLTKPDRIGRGDHENWVRFIKNEIKPLESGWFSVKQPDTQAVQDGITWEEARAEEEKFFSQASPWCSLDSGLREHLGTTNLTERLSSILSSLIAKRLPELQDELQKLIIQTEEALRQLPPPPSSDAVTELLHLVSNFIQDVSRHIEGTPEENGLLQATRSAHVQFKHAIRATAPNFRAVAANTTSEVTENRTASRGFLANEDDEPDAVDESTSSRPIYIEEVMKRAEQARTRELPDHYPFVVSNGYIRAIVTEWNVPARTLFDATERILLAQIKAIISRHFGKYTQGNLHMHVTAIVNKHLKDCGLKTMKQIQWLQELEKRPRTMNDHYFSDYKDKFLALYRASRQKSSHPDLSQYLAQYKSRSMLSATSDESLPKAMSGLSAVGFKVSAIDLLKLLPPDPFEPALHIMSTVRAYFQVAYKRFVDNVPNAIDYELVLGMNRDHSLEDVLYSGLGITGSHAGKRCRELLAEPPHIVARRKDLLKRKERLESAKKELMNLWL